MDSNIAYSWRGALSDDEMVELVNSYGGHSAQGWWDHIKPYTLGWVTARSSDGTLIGFVNVAWDGGDHAFLIRRPTATGNVVVSGPRLSATPRNTRRTLDASGCTSTSHPSLRASTTARVASETLTPA